ncbi:MAG: Aminodeoxychorismate lyase [Parcubacteria group bacterium GW2011_GWA2_47_21]|nr:MAG: Aminodeoxychorismate lyase [Parcubacteria group bacterium GW2011_GWA2_47_21]
MKSSKELIDYLIERKILKTPRIIEAFRAVDRAAFVLPEYKDEAYENHPLPIGEGQTISQPETVAFMLEKLDPAAGEKILDVGSGSGWTTALLADIAGDSGKVFGIERIPSLCELGRKNLEKSAAAGRAKIMCGDGTKTVKDEGPFDKILASAEAHDAIPEEWRRKLKPGGKIVAPVDGAIVILEKKSADEWDEKKFPGFAFVPLIRGGKNPEDTPRGKIPFLETKPGTRILRIFIVFLGIIILLMLNEIYYPHSSFDGKKRIAIPQGAGSRVIGAELKKEGVIRSRWTFVAYVTLRGSASDLKPGEYTFFSDMDIPEITNDLIRGGATEILLTVPEGWAAADIAKKLESEKVVTAREFLSAAGYPNTDYRIDQKLPLPETRADTFSFLADKPWYIGFEGYLFPDTYRIFRNSEPREIIEKMLENMDEKLTPDLREEIVRQKKSIFSIITIASLIEKEVRIDEDRAIVSGIFWKRLERGMPLQVDATINYITGGKDPSATREETKINSPYNTYLYHGLPLGPIANPGLSAIRAAIYPKKSPYLFYLSTPDGTTIFSRTLDEHNAAKRKYLR